MEIYNILKEQHARGRNKAIPLKKLAEMLHVTTRQVKRWIEIERRKHLICSTTSGGGGYYRPQNRKEIAAYVKHQEKLIQAHAKTLRLARRFERRARQADRGGGV